MELWHSAASPARLVGRNWGVVAPRPRDMGLKNIDTHASLYARRQDKIILSFRIQCDISMKALSSPCGQWETSSRPMPITDDVSLLHLSTIREM